MTNPKWTATVRFENPDGSLVAGKLSGHPPRILDLIHRLRSQIDALRSWCGRGSNSWTDRALSQNPPSCCTGARQRE